MSLTRPIYPTHPQSKNLNAQIRQKDKLRVKIKCKIGKSTSVVNRYLSIYVISFVGEKIKIVSSFSVIKLCFVINVLNTVEPPFATTSRKRPVF